MPTTYASAKQFLGLAKETTHGTAVAMSTTMPVDEFTAEQSFEWLKDEAWRGHMGDVSGIHQGVTKTEWSLKGPVFLDTVGHLLLNCLGDLTTTSATPNSHAFALLNSGSAQPASHTFTHFQGPVATTGARRVPGSCVSELSFKFNAESELFTLEAKGTGWGTDPVPSSAPTASPSTVVPLASWRGVVTIGGSAAANVSEFELSIKRELKPIYTMSATGQSPYIIQRGKLGCTGKVMFVADGETPFTKYLARTQEAVQVVIDNGLSGASKLGVTFLLSTCNWDNVKLDAGNEYIGYEGEYTGISNSTNAGASGGMSPLKVTVENSISAY